MPPIVLEKLYLLSFLTMRVDFKEIIRKENPIWTTSILLTTMVKLIVLGIFLQKSADIYFLLEYD